MSDADKLSAGLNECRENKKAHSPEIQKSTSYPGIGRVGFFWGFLIIWFLSGILQSAMHKSDEIKPYAPLFAFAYITFLVFILTTLRLQNIGRSFWWLLLLIIPIVNLVVLLPCFYAPPGYAHTKKLDLTGKIIIPVLIILLLLISILIADIAIGIYKWNYSV